MAYNIFSKIYENYEKNIFVFGSHQYALYYWAKGIHRKNISKNSTLIHIDFHTDFLKPRFDKKISVDFELIEMMIKNKMIHYDDFIKVALNNEMIKYIIFCCKPQHGETNDPTPYKNYISPIVISDILNTYLSNKQKMGKNDIFLCKNILNNDVILDIDLDFFVDFESDSLKFKNEDLIINEIEAINKLFNYSKITTICTSHDWCFDDSQLQYVQNIFANNFIVDLDFSHSPCKIIHS